TKRIKLAVQSALGQSKPRPIERLAALKRPFKFKVRNFDEANEEAAVTRYCQKYAPDHADKIIPVFRNMRKELAAKRGETRETWLQVLRIGAWRLWGCPPNSLPSLDSTSKTALRSVTPTWLNWPTIGLVTFQTRKG